MGARFRLATLIAVLSAAAAASCAREAAPATDAIFGRSGEIRWFDVAEGKLKAEVFTTAHVSEHPILIVVLHGDLPTPGPSYQYAFAQAVAQGFDAPGMPDDVRARLQTEVGVDDVVAVGILRPGYTDSAGDRSDGELGYAAGDNYTPEVTEAVAAATAELKAEYNPRATVFVGHSGGATIEANMLGRHPGLADAALLVACGCDPEASRARTREIRTHPMWQGPTRSLQPLETVAGVSSSVKVRLVVGADDDAALIEYSERYAAALEARGADAEVTVAPGLGHNIMFTQVVFNSLGELLRGL